MKRSVTVFAVSIFIFSLSTAGFAESLLLDDFETEIISTPVGTIDAGAANGSTLEVGAEQEIKHSGQQSLKIVYDAVAGGYMWVARGFGLDVKGAARWLVKPEEIDWPDYRAISFYMYGSGSDAKIAFDIKDAGGEMFRFMVTDDVKGWKQIVCPFEEFFPRGDWQPPSAEVNATLDFPIRSFQFEPIAVAKATLYMDEVKLEPRCEKCEKEMK